MQQICALCQSNFHISQKDKEYYEKVDCPYPTRCPHCRERSRVAFRNERNYYPYECEQCHQAGISIYQSGKIPHLMCQECFWSDAWDARNTGRDFDFSKTFTENFALLLADTPRIAMMNDNDLTSENCAYTYNVSFVKNCYLVDTSWKIENCQYGSQLSRVKDSLDLYFGRDSEWLYECTYSHNCSGCRYCIECTNCTDCIFGYALVGCKNCFFCSHLNHKQYCIRNQQYSKEDYEAYIEKAHLGSWKSVQILRGKFREFLKKYPVKYADILLSEEVSGDHMQRCRDCTNCYEVNNFIHSAYCHVGDGAEHCYDCSVTGGSTCCYENIVADNSYMVGFSFFCRESKFCLYCDNCLGCHDCFGCVSLRKGEYCIFNKRYSPTEYHALKQRILEHMKTTGEWGNYFHPSLCTHGYNETLAMEWHPLNKEEALKLGYSWQDTLPGSLGKETVSMEGLPDDIAHFESTDDRLINGVYACERCQRNFKFIPQELNFYLQKTIPIPHLCPHCRHEDRIRGINPAHLRVQQCDGILQNGEKCHNICTTTHPEISEQRILCEDCYRKKIY